LNLPKFLRETYKDYRDLASETSDALRGLGPYLGPWAAAIDPLQEAGIAALSDVADARQGEARAIIELAQRMIDPSYMDPTQDPAFVAALDAAVGPLERARARQLARVRAIAAGSGADLSSRMPFAESSATAQTDEQMKELAAMMTLAEIQSRRDASLKAPALFGQGYVLEENPGRLMSELGDYRRALITETEVKPRQMQFQEFVNAINRPMGPYQTFFGSVGAPTNQTTTQQNNPWVGLLQGALGGAALGSQLGKGTWGTAAGAILGGVAGALGG
jgi:hypothetical protein